MRQDCAVTMEGEFRNLYAKKTGLEIICRSSSAAARKVLLATARLTCSGCTSRWYSLMPAAPGAGADEVASSPSFSKRWQVDRMSWATSRACKRPRHPSWLLLGNSRQLDLTRVKYNPWKSLFSRMHKSRRLVHAAFWAAFGYKETVAARRG